MPNDRFKTRLKIAKEKLKSKDLNKRMEQKSNIGNAFKMSTELVSAVAVGTIIGFILDGWFDTKPWFIIVFFVIGITAGIMNVVKSAKKMQKNNNKN